MGSLREPTQLDYWKASTLVNAMMFAVNLLCLWGGRRNVVLKIAILNTCEYSPLSIRLPELEDDTKCCKFGQALPSNLQHFELPARLRGCFSDRAAWHQTKKSMCE